MKISIHALLAESDGFDSGTMVPAEKFLSTLSLRRATITRQISPSCTGVFLSTLSLRRATVMARWSFHGLDISIHALLAESDRGERGFDRSVEFLSTLSLRRATLAGPSGPAFLFNFYPRSPCGERQADSVSQWTAT